MTPKNITTKVELCNYIDTLEKRIKEVRLFIEKYKKENELNVKAIFICAELRFKYCFLLERRYEMN